MPKRMSRFWSVGLVLILGLALWAAAVGAADTPDPDVRFIRDAPTNITPGPGWPKGWTAPATPSGLPSRAQALWEQEKAALGDQAPTKLDWRVMPYMPDWTKQYPYIWQSDSMVCGKTRYYIWYPVPDQDVLQANYGDPYTFSVHGGRSSDCTFTGVVGIAKFNLTPEQKERARLEDLLNQALDYSRLGRIDQGGLQPFSPSSYEGIPENILVCFNDGNASARFDVPAYLDTKVGRVRVPVRFVSEMMRGEVSWDGATQTVTLHFPAITVSQVRPKLRPGTAPSDWVDPNDYGHNGNYDLVETRVFQPEHTVTLQVGKDVALVDGRERRLDAPPVNLPPGRVMVPLRFVAEAMGAKVYWVGKEPIFRNDKNQLSGTYQVHIYTTLYPFYDYPNWFLENRALKF